ncbi:MAG: DUF4352 domain-containing protein [Chloroflexi bacterium]|nr:DUF4352 domain-containing protein [Chloroflexota bacterium]
MKRSELIWPLIVLVLLATFLTFRFWDDLAELVEEVRHAGQTELHLTATSVDVSVSEDSGESQARVRVVFSFRNEGEESTPVFADDFILTDGERSWTASDTAGALSLALLGDLGPGLSRSTSLRFVVPSGAIGTDLVLAVSANSVWAKTMQLCLPSVDAVRSVGGNLSRTVSC